MLNLENLKKFYINDFGEKKIVFDNLNLKIKKGDFVCIMGGNGAGKTTLFNTILGNTELNDGNIILENENITNFKKHKRNYTRIS